MTTFALLVILTFLDDQAVYIVPDLSTEDCIDAEQLVLKKLSDVGIKADIFTRCVPMDELYHEEGVRLSI